MDLRRLQLPYRYGMFCKLRTAIKAFGYAEDHNIILVPDWVSRCYSEPPLNNAWDQFFERIGHEQSNLFKKLQLLMSPIHPMNSTSKQLMNI